jgi:hypothetical protein
MPDQKDAIAILLAEFQALRTEIAVRSGAQGTMMQLAVTAFGALAGLAFTQYGDHRMLLLIPVTSAILGLIWLDHATNISNIGDYIKNQIMPALRRAAEMETLPDYETAVREYERTPGAFFRVFGLPPFLIFILVPLVAMITAFDFTPRGWLFWTLLLFDAVLLIVFTVRWLPFLDSPRQRVSAK